jgi:hypothetical protein
MYKCKQACAFTTKEGTKTFELGKKYTKEELSGIVGTKDFGHVFKGETPYFVELADEETTEEVVAPKTSKKEEKKEEVADDKRV